jgi:Subtilase family
VSNRSVGSPTARTRGVRRTWAAVTGLFAAILVVAGVLGAEGAVGGKTGGDPAAVETATDEAKQKLHPRLLDQVEAGSNERIKVFATVTGDPAQARELLANDHRAGDAEFSFLVGTIGVQQLPKLASLESIVGVGPIDLRKSGHPLGNMEPRSKSPLDADKQDSPLERLREAEVAHSKAPPLKGSNFEELKRLGVLDAKTHNFKGAWDAGYAGEGTTVGVLDGGTDWGHPDLIGTWKTWNATDAGAHPGWVGWPKAFDPFGTLLWVFAPGNIQAGLSFYTFTQAKTGTVSGNTMRVSFATRTGPSRNFDAPDGFNTHTYRFPKAWTKSGTVRIGGHPDDHLLQLFAERPAFLVVDPNTAGVYDTVYVDLDNDFRFDDEKPVSKSSPVSYRDMNGDGYTDISGGLLYYISDGTGPTGTPVPGGLTSFGINARFAPGEVLAWTGDYDPAIGGHGTLTASNIVAQGVINGMAPCFADLPASTGGGENEDGRPCPKGFGTYPGAVIGGAPKAKLTPYGDIYFAFDFSTQFGDFLAVRRQIDVTTHSFGSSAVDNDGYDSASQEGDFIHASGPTAPPRRRTTWLGSTGNGAPGFGTTAPPSPSSGIDVGASTQFGGTGWDSIKNISQVTDNDVMVWSNRGPGATGDNGVDVVADGAFSAGDATLNTILDGRNAWNTWGGTSRSGPVAGAATALIYQAYRAANGGTIPVDFWARAKQILKSSAQDLGYGSWIQGAGSVDAGKAVQLAATAGGQAVSPDEWRPGSYRGTDHTVFTHMLAPGGTDTQTFNLPPGEWQIADRYMRRTGSETLNFTSSPVSRESAFNFNAPDYLFDISSMVNAHPNAELMVVRANFDHSQLDPDENYEEDQHWRLLTYDWTDIDGDGRLWRDRDQDGVVDHVHHSNDLDIDGNPRLRFDTSRTEVDQYEYVRFMYHRAFTNTLQSFVRIPDVRTSDGIFLGLQHELKSAAIPTTAFKIQIDFYDNDDWAWLTHPASATGSFTATMNVPADTPLGMYDGALRLTQGSDEIIVPVSLAVGGEVQQDAAGKVVGSLTFGGESVANAQADLLYNNGSVFGGQDWSWRAESGDWRFYFYDVPNTPPDGTLFLAQSTWNDDAPFTDLDTLIFGRSENHFAHSGVQVTPDGVFGGPYIIDLVGGSPNTNVGAGVWLFDTTSGANSDLVAAPAQEGLHALVHHQVDFQGGKFHVPFETKLGGASVSPNKVEITTSANSGNFEITFESGIDLPGLVAEGFGLSQPAVTSETASQDNPNDPSTASVKKNVTIDHASRARFAVDLLGGADDIDLYVVYDQNGDGLFTNDEIVGSSTGPGGANEFIELVRPADGAYQVWAQGWQVAGNPTFELTIDVIQGVDVTATAPAGPVTAGTPVTVSGTFNKPSMTPGDWFGEVLMGPPSAPEVISVPVTIHRTP